MARTMQVLYFLLPLVVLAQGKLGYGHGHTSQYKRKLQVSHDMPLNADVFKEPTGFNAPQQVHITQGDFDGKAVIISWITPASKGSPYVYYRRSSSDEDGKVPSDAQQHQESNYKRATAFSTGVRYAAHNYISGFIHHCKLDDLEYDTKYSYKLGEGESSREFVFTTPPEPGPHVPYTFSVIGDLGQTVDSNRTLQHHLQTKGQAVLFVGDLAYADKYPFYDNHRWDTWSRLIERSAAYRPWIWATGNHDIEYGPEFGELETFKSFNHRFRTPYESSNSSSPLWYSIQRGPAHIIVLSSYSSFVKYTPQYRWLEQELAKVDREKTPWLIVMMHISFYSSNLVHYLEGEPMRNAFESWFVKYKVDIVFSGHVHAYERTHRVSNIALSPDAHQPRMDGSAPLYVVIGDGGNMEGLASMYMDPQPGYSAFREASFGHGHLHIRNHTHASFSWHRNDDGEAVEADSVWLKNVFTHPREASLPASQQRVAAAQEAAFPALPTCQSQTSHVCMYEEASCVEEVAYF